MINFAQHVINNNQHHLTKYAMRDGTEDLTYGDLCDRVPRVAQALLDQGVRRGDHVIIRLDDSVDWPVVFLACLHQGIRPLPITTGIPVDLVCKIADFTDCKAMITRDRDINSVACAKIMIPRSQIQSWRQYPDLANTVMVHPDSPAWMNMSSGSTGLPKIAVHRHQTLFEILRISPYHSFSMTADSTILSTPKMSWNYGLHNSITYTLGLGATAIVIPDPPTAGTVFEYLHRFCPDTVISSPSIIRRLLAPKAQHHTLPHSVRHFNSSGEHLPAHLYHTFLERFGVKISSCIGMMETCTNYAANPDWEHDAGTVGRPLPDCDVKLVDGEVYVNSPANACYYYNNHDATRRTFQGEWVKTGDRARWNDQGNLVFEGRVDDSFKVNDLIVNPIAIEDEILKHTAVEQVAVAGIPNAQGVKETHAFLVVSQAFDADVFRSAIKDRLAAHQIPRHLHLVDSLPETANHKKTRRNLEPLAPV